MGETTKVPVLLLVGRAQLVSSTLCHGFELLLILLSALSFYEGHSIEQTAFATRVCKVLGIQTMLVTNAAGGLNQDYAVGDIVIINDVRLLHPSQPGLDIRANLDEAS